jgi:hypothetical protein
MASVSDGVPFLDPPSSANVASDPDRARGPAATHAVPRRADGEDHADQHRQTLREMRDSHSDRKSDRKQRQQKSGGRPRPAADHLAALTGSIELSVLIHLNDLQEPFGLAGPQLPEQSRSPTPAAPILSAVTAVIAPVPTPITPVIAPVPTPLATSEKAGSVPSVSEQRHLHAPLSAAWRSASTAATSAWVGIRPLVTS